MYGYLLPISEEMNVAKIPAFLHHTNMEIFPNKCSSLKVMATLSKSRIIM